MADRLVADDTVVDQILQEGGVGEVEAFVDPHGDDAGVGFDPVPPDVAEVLGAGNQPDLGHMGTRGLVEKHQDRQGDPGGDADFHPREQGQQDGGGDGGKIDAVVGPGSAQDRQVDEAENRDDDRGSQHGLGQEEQQRGQQQRGQGQAEGGEGSGGGCFGARVEVHDRPGKAAGDREAARKGRRDVGGTEADKLLIRDDALASLRGEGPGDGDGFDKADDGDQQGGNEEVSPERGGEGRQGQRRQAGRHVSDHRDALVRKAEGADRKDRQRHRHHRAGLGQQIGGARRKPGGTQQGLQPPAHPEEEDERGRADRQRGRLRVAEMRHDAADHADQVRSARLYAEDMTDLRGRDEDAGGGDEPGDDRVREEVRQKAKPEQAHGQQHHPRQEGQRDRRRDIVGRALRRDLARRGRRHQRHNRNRAHRQRARCAEDRVGQQRQDGGVETHFGRQSGQQGVGQRLRDQHDRDDHRRHEVRGQRVPVIAARPVEDRDMPPEPGGRDQAL